MLPERVTTPASPASFFTGREAFLHTLRETLRAEHLAVITGARGVGKTATAREYIRLFAHEYRQVLWIDATMFSSLLSDTLDLARRFNLPLEKEQGLAGVIAAIQEWSSAQKDTLVVLDNVIFPANALQLAELHPIEGHVLLIAQDLENTSDLARQLQSFLEKQANLTQPVLDKPANRPAATSLRLPALTEDEGALLVLRRAELLAADKTLEQADGQQCQLARQLARELQGGPLALILAAAYIKETGCGLQHYLLAFRDDSTQPDSTSSEALQIVEPACNLLLTHLERTHSAAPVVLQICALLAPSSIPLALFQQESLQEAIFPQQREPQTALLAGTLQLLLAHGLLETRGDSAVLAMPPLLHTAVRRLMPMEKRHQLQEQLLRACLQRALSSASQDQTLSTYINLAGHIWFLAVLDEEHVYSVREAADAFAWAASLLDEQGLTHEAEYLLRSVLTTWEHTLGRAHPTIAGVQLHLAILNARLQQYTQAETYAQMAITNTSQAAGVNHPDVLYSLTVLGQIYQQQSKYQPARLCYEKALSIGERVGLQQHPHYLAARRLLQICPADPV